MTIIFVIVLQVSWIRRRDAHILTVDRYTFIADERFQAFLVEATDTWTLQIKYVQARDAGQYECQVSTEPKMSHFITLNVVGKSSLCTLFGPNIQSTYFSVLTYLLTYLLHGAESFLRNLLVLQLVKKFPAFYRTRKYITIFTSARHLSLS